MTLAIDTNYHCSRCGQPLDVAVISHTDNVYTVAVEPCKVCIEEVIRMTVENSVNLTAAMLGVTE